MGADGLHIELSAEEQDAGAVALEAVEASGSGLHALNLAVESLADGVGDAVLPPRQDVAEMLLEHSCDLLHRFELRVDRVAIPFLEVFRRLRLAFGQLPEEPEGLLDEPCFGGLQLAVLDVAEAQILLVAEVVLVPEPQVARPLEPVVALGEKLLVLLGANLVHAFVEVLGDETADVQSISTNFV